MPVRTGGSYVVDPKTGDEKLRERTKLEDPNRVEEEPAAEVPTAPAAEPPQKPAAHQGRRSSQPQE